MRLPRDISGHALATALGKLGYSVTRQTGSHIRASRAMTGERAEHHVTIPAHDAIKVGTLNAILREIAQANGLERDELLQVLFD